MTDYSVYVIPLSHKKINLDNIIRNNDQTLKEHE